MRKAGRWMLAAVMFLGPAALGQDAAKPDDYKKLYEDTLGQLKASQDRKAELADENAKMAAQMAELQKQHETDGAALMAMKIQTAGFSERTLFLRVHYNAWLQFVAVNPMVLMQWDAFVDRLGPVGPSIQLPLIDPDWPLSDK